MLVQLRFWTSEEEGVEGPKNKFLGRVCFFGRRGAHHSLGDGRGGGQSTSAGDGFSA